MTSFDQMVNQEDICQNLQILGIQRDGGSGGRVPTFTLAWLITQISQSWIQSQQRAQAEHGKTHTTSQQHPTMWWPAFSGQQPECQWCWPDPQTPSLGIHTGSPAGQGPAQTHLQQTGQGSAWSPNFVSQYSQSYAIYYWQGPSTNTPITDMTGVSMIPNLCL